MDKTVTISLSPKLQTALDNLIKINSCNSATDSFCDSHIVDDNNCGACPFYAGVSDDKCEKVIVSEVLRVYEEGERG